MPIGADDRAEMVNLSERPKSGGRAPRGTPKPPVVEGAAVELGIAAAIYGAIKGARKSWVPRNVYASKLKECDLALVFSMLGFTEEDVGADNPHWSMSAEAGTALHNILEKHSEAIPGFKRAEFRVRSEDGSVTGRADLELEIDGELVGLDWKTVGDKDFKLGLAGHKFEGYKAQVDAYSYILGWKRAIIVLLNRDNGRMAEYELVPDPENGERLVENAARLVEAARNKMLVEPSKQPGGKDCFFCSFKELCRNRAGAQTLLRKGYAVEAIDRQLGQLGVNERRERLHSAE